MGKVIGGLFDGEKVCRYPKERYLIVETSDGIRPITRNYVDKYQYKPDLSNDSSVVYIVKWADGNKSLLRFNSLWKEDFIYGCEFGPCNKNSCSLQNSNSSTSLASALKSIFIISAIIGIVLYFFVQIITSTSSEEETSSSPKSPAPSKWATWDGEGDPPNAYVVIVTGEFEQSQYATTTGYINGYAHNRTGKKISYIHINYGIYSESGTKLGSCSDAENTLSADTGWQFRAFCTGLPSGQFIYKVDDVSYW